MIEKRPMHPPDSAPPVVGAGQPIPEYLLRSLPELRVLPDWAAFLAWQKACGKRTQRSYRWHILWLTAVGALAGTLGGLGGPLLARLLGRIGITGVAAVATAASLASLFAVCTTGMITVWLVRGRTRRRVREGLVALGYPVCLHCGYDLRGSPEPRCSECGTPFDPAERERIIARIASLSPKARYAWLAALVVTLLTLAVAGGLIVWRQAAAAAAKRAAAPTTQPSPPKSQGGGREMMQMPKAGVHAGSGPRMLGSRDRSKRRFASGTPPNRACIDRRPGQSNHRQDWMGVTSPIHPPQVAYALK